MKNLIFIIVLIALVGCKEKAPTEPKINLDKEYTLEELENDTDWVEVTDIDTIQRPCINAEIYKEGIHIISKNELENLYNDSKSLYGNLDSDSCINDFDKYNINFNSLNMILYYNTSNGKSRVNRKIFMNNDKLIYFIEFDESLGYEDRKPYADRILIPKVAEVKFITKRIY